MIGFLVIVLVAAAVLYAVVAGGVEQKKRRGSNRGGRSYRPAGRLDPADIGAKWAVIKLTAESGPGGLKNAITEADKLVDFALRGAGVAGDTMGERLKAARSRFGSNSTYDALWRAHKLRNALAHEVGFDLVPSQAREALQGFERGLKDLGALK